MTTQHQRHERESAETAAALKELREDNEQLRKENQTLREKIATLENRLSKLEAEAADREPQLRLAECFNAVNNELRQRLEKAIGCKPEMGATFQAFISGSRSPSDAERAVWLQFQTEFPQVASLQDSISYMVSALSGSRNKLSHPSVKNVTKEEIVQLLEQVFPELPNDYPGVAEATADLLCRATTKKDVSTK